MTDDPVQKLKEILAEAETQISKCANFSDLENFRNKFLGRRETFSQILRQVKDLPKEQRPAVGRLGNEVKKSLEKMILEAEARLRPGPDAEKNGIDETLPGEKIEPGHLHPLTINLRKVIDLFVRMGFEVVEGLEIETTKYNFDLLNIPKDHPSRDVWDTFYIEVPEGLKRQIGQKGQKRQEGGLLLRTHTSPMQIRAMEKRKPPVRLIVPGRVFRHEATDAGHETTFYQCEGLVIDKDIKVTDLVGTIKLILKSLFGKNVKIRVRPHFYAFTEPSMDFDMSCLLCSGKGCPVCGQTGWLEIMGSGMVHPKVLKNMRIDPAKYTGFAFGLGIDRLMMLYYGIDDIRLSYQNDLRFLRQF